MSFLIVVNVVLLTSYYHSLIVHNLPAAEGADEEDCGNMYDRIVYDSRLGLGVERMQEGLTLESLWKVV
jgi:hypothetical protein